jgi:MoaA/NifB/PqqE/SkfB family radical SAM enzyme
MQARTEPLYLRVLGRAERRSVPISVAVELTHACNLDCEMCYLDLQPDKKIGALSTEEWKDVFEQLAQAGCLFLIMTGGELLLRRDWFELATHARSLGFALRLYTNATLIDDATADRIASLRPLGVEVSLHGARAETQDRIARKTGSFDKVMRGVGLLRDRGVPVLLKCVVSRHNFREID